MSAFHKMPTRSAGRMFTALVAVLLGACRQDMHDQPKYEPLERSTLFADGRSSRPSIPGTVARGELFEDDHLHRGRVDGELAQTFPLALSEELLDRGRERFGIFCTPCHDRAGTGGGTVVERGMPRPDSFHVPRLLDSPHGYFFDVITSGFGRMYDFSDRIPAEDRWAIVAYIRVLQRSQRSTLADVPSADVARLEGERQ